MAAPKTQDHDADSDSETSSLNIFTDPPDYYPPPPPSTTCTHILLSGQVLTLHLVGHNPLWGHHLWNAGRLISTYLEQNPSLVKGKTILELGAGAGLPSIVCGVLGAGKVVVSDYPDPDLVANLWTNIKSCLPSSTARPEPSLLEDRGPRGGEGGLVVAEGYCWGADPEPLLSHLTPSIATTAESSSHTPGSRPKFEVLILADLLFNHSEHAKLVATIKSTLARQPDAKALVFFTPYRPWLYDKDMAFFDLVKEEGFLVEKLLEEKMEKVMFEEDPGDEELRRTVFGFVVRWP
jgi:nicotinamide N-methyltransferase